MDQDHLLVDFKTGDRLVLKEVLDPQLSIQLYCMGFLPGEVIQIEKIAPFGDPYILSVDDSFISLRKSDAQKIKVKKTEN